MCTTFERRVRKSTSLKHSLAAFDQVNVIHKNNQNNSTKTKIQRCIAFRIKTFSDEVEADTVVLSSVNNIINKVMKS